MSKNAAPPGGIFLEAEDSGTTAFVDNVHKFEYTR